MRTDPLYPLALAQATLSLVVHGSSKAGKTTLSATCPKPMLLLDAEGGTKFLPYRKVTWDPIAGPPPPPDGSWDVCVVTVRQYEQLSMVYQWLALGQHGFASLSVDSLTEVQRRCKKSLLGTSEEMKQQLWGSLLDKMLGLVRDLRDLTLHPTVPLSAVCFITETKMSNGKWRPYAQGQLADTLPYTVDILGFLDVVDVLPDQNNPLAVVKQRQLLITPDFNHEAGERVQGRLGNVVVNPDVQLMLAQVYPQYYVQPA